MFVHVTCATDTKNTRAVMESVQQIVLQGYLGSMGYLT